MSDPIVERTPRLNELVELLILTRSSITHTQDSDNFDRKIKVENVIKAIASLILPEDYDGSALKDLVTNSGEGFGYYNILNQTDFEYYFGSADLVEGDYTLAGWYVGGTFATPVVEMPPNIILRFRAGTYQLKRNLQWHSACILIGEGTGVTVVAKGTYTMINYPSVVYDMQVPTGGGIMEFPGWAPPIGSIIGLHPEVKTTVGLDPSIWSPCIAGGADLPSANFTLATQTKVPNLTDDRFLMGGSVYGVGGTNDSKHVHQIMYSSETFVPGSPGIFSLNSAANGMLQTSFTEATAGAQYFAGTLADYSGGGSGTVAQLVDSSTARNFFSASPVDGNGNLKNDSRPVYFKVKYYIRIR